MKTVIPSVLITFVLVCFALVQNTQAVIPPPDGGYPGGNTAEGTKALLSQTTGGYNAAIGWLSLENLTTGSFNTGVGAGTLALNNGDQNTATGAGALLSHATGNGNTANGAFALFSDISGQANTADGGFALFSNTTGNFNTANGALALFSNTAGTINTANGYLALSHNTTGGGNTANGYQALLSNTTGSNNTANGVFALSSNTEGDANTATGSQALSSNDTGNYNTANGTQALANNTTGIGNTALGFGAGNLVTTADHVIAIGAAGGNVSNTCYIGNIRGVTTVNADAIPVLIDSAGQLGTMSSSRRFKKEVKAMDKASEAILAFKPVTFHYKNDAKGTSQFGLIAEEVAEVNPALVVRDENGEIYTVRYDAVNAMLLNEFLKEHRKVENLEATVAQQHKDFEAAVAELKGQIQKVSAQLELSKSAPQTVLNNHQSLPRRTKNLRFPKLGSAVSVEE